MFTGSSGRRGAAYNADYPQKHYGADNGGDEVADDAARGDAYEAEEPAAEHAADYPYHEIHYKAEATSAHEFAGNESGYDSDDYVPDKSHEV